MLAFILKKNKIHTFSTILVITSCIIYLTHITCKSKLLKHHKIDCGFLDVLISFLHNVDINKYSSIGIETRYEGVVDILAENEFPITSINNYNSNVENIKIDWNKQNNVEFELLILLNFGNDISHENMSNFFKSLDSVKMIIVYWNHPDIHLYSQHSITIKNLILKMQYSGFQLSEEDTLYLRNNSTFPTIGNLVCVFNKL